MYIDTKGRQLFLSQSPQTWSGGGGILYGDSRRNGFYGAGNDTLIGGTGDDTYVVWVTTTQIVENANAGTDTLESRIWGTATLPAWVENLILSGPGSTGGFGNALANILIAGKVGAVLDGLAGDDVLVAGVGVDILQVNAGNGSDVIENFTPGIDVVELGGYGIDGFDAVKRIAEQTGDDLTLSFANGESLVLRNVDLAELDAYDFGFNEPFPTLPPGHQSLSGPGKAYTAFGWYVLNNVWNPGSLAYKADYLIDSSFDPRDLTSGVTFAWSFPLKTEAYPTIIAYPEVIFGPAPMGGGGKKSDVGGMFPLRIDTIDELTARYDVSFEGNTGGFDVAFDIWLTDEPNGRSDSVTTEVMVWLHKGGVVPSGSVVGQYQEGDDPASIYMSKGGTWTYTAVVFDEDRPEGAISITGILETLVELGIVSPSEYLASVELGAEVVAGAGRLTINDLTLEAEVDDRRIVTTGGGTTVTDRYIGGEGADRIHYDPARKLIDGGEGSDILVVNESIEVRLDHFSTSQVAGGAYVRRFESVDATAATGSVTLVGSDYSNTITGGASGDRIDAGSGADIVRGGAGADTIDGGAGSDRVLGDAGDDRVFYDAADYVIDGGAGKDTLALRKTAEVRLDHFATSQVAGGAYVLNFENVDASAAAASVTLVGSDRANILTGGAQADTLTGGAGSDRFVFTSVPNPGRADTITDFLPGEDRLVLDGGAFGLAPGGLGAGVLAIGRAANPGNLIIYDPESGILSFDADGSGGASVPIALADLTSGLTLRATDFWID